MLNYRLLVLLNYVKSLNNPDLKAFAALDELPDNIQTSHFQRSLK